MMQEKEEMINPGKLNVFETFNGATIILSHTRLFMFETVGILSLFSVD